MDTLITLDQTNFQNEVVNSDKPVLVDFWAPWCMPCLMIAPVIEEISKDFNGKVKVGKLNTDENHSIAAEFDIRGIPSLLIYKNGKVVDQIVGVVPKEHITRKLEQYTEMN